MVAQAVKTFGQLDILVNNAGAYEFCPLEAITERHFHKLFDLNVLGTILVTQAALPHFCSRGGSVINISSVVSVCPSEHGPRVFCHQGGNRCPDEVLGESTSASSNPFQYLNPGLTPTEGVKSLERRPAVSCCVTFCDRRPLAATVPLRMSLRPPSFSLPTNLHTSLGRAFLVSGGRR